MGGTLSRQPASHGCSSVGIALSTDLLMTLPNLHRFPCDISFHFLPCEQILPAICSLHSDCVV